MQNCGASISQFSACATQKGDADHASDILMYLARRASGLDLLPFVARLVGFSQARVAESRYTYSAKTLHHLVSFGVNGAEER